MRIHLADTAGFCFGVARAVDTLMAESDRKKIATIGPIIHNRSVVDELSRKGVESVESIDDISGGTEAAVRTHGVPKSVIDSLTQKGIPYIDLTCPFVKKIHRIVSEKYAKGYKIVIVGDEQHPEVKGINGWCGESAVIATDPKDIEGKIDFDNPICMVSQTTMDRETFKKIEKFLKNHCKNIVIFDTICSATDERQKEAEKIARESDIMFVIGGQHSANTNKLTTICKKYCANVYQIENFEEIPQNIDMSDKKVGITAGASTPSWIIKEAIGKMNEKNTNVNDSFAQEFEEYEKALITLNTGDIVKGSVMRVDDKGISVNLGYKSDGFVPASEVTDDPDADIKSLYKEGDEIEVFVVRVNDVEGEVTLSRKKIDAINSVKVVEEALESKEILKGKVIQAVNGGVIVTYKGARVFIPASLASDRFLNDLNVLVGNDVEFRIIDIKRVRNRTRVIGSVKEVLKEQKAVLAENFWNEIEVGKRYQGVVKSLTKFGAFVDIGGVDGLIHISELSWTKIKHPSEIVKEGDLVDTYVLEFDKEKGKVSLGFKKSEDNPWLKAKQELEVGKDISCKIVRIVPFGAFAEIYPGVDGLIHISQVADKRIGKVEDELIIGQHVTARVVELDLDNQKIGLSIRAILEENAKEAQAEETAEEVAEEAVEEVAAEEVAETDAE